MPMIEVDFDTYKALVNRRPSENVSEGDVVKTLLGLSRDAAPGPGKAWVSEGVEFWIGSKLRHRFRNGDMVTAEVVDDGIRVNGQTFNGASPAATFVAGHQTNGWQFWEIEDGRDSGKWIKIDALRHR